MLEIIDVSLSLYIKRLSIDMESFSRQQQHIGTQGLNTFSCLERTQLSVELRTTAIALAVPMQTQLHYSRECH